MYKGKKVIVVMPAYNAARTLRKTWDEVMAQEIVDLQQLVRKTPVAENIIRQAVDLVTVEVDHHVWAALVLALDHGELVDDEPVVAVTVEVEAPGREVELRGARRSVGPLLVAGDKAKVGFPG